MAIKAGIVGTGFSASAHADALRRLPGVEVVAIVGRTRERAAAAATELGVARSHASVEELLADDEIRVVHNCAPNDMHAEVNLAVLGAERHLLAEKPLGRSAAEAHVQVDAAARAGVVAGVCFNYRHYPLVQHLREVVRAGDYGPVHLVHGGYLQDWLLYDTDWNWRLDPVRNGPSRAIADIGSHWLDLVQHVLGRSVVEVCASLGTLHEERLRPPHDGPTFGGNGDGSGERFRVTTEDFGSILLRFGGGVRGSLTVSQVSAGRKNRLQLELDAADAALAWNQEDAGRLWIGHRGAANETLVRSAPLLRTTAAELARLPAGHEEGWADAVLNMVADFYAAVDAQTEGRPYEHCFATFAEGAQVCSLVDAILESDDAGAWTRVRARRREEVDV